MSWTMACFTYVNLWWVCLFFVWPFCIEQGQPGSLAPLEYAAAPKKIYWKKMLVANSLVSAIITAILTLVILNLQ
ncbi:MAG: DUF1467 family protein [Alphaproteobacteria bacterium]